MTLRERRVKFTKLLCQTILWASSQGWEIAFDEIRVITPRRVRPLVGGPAFMAMDAVHIPSSFHYQGLAADLLLYIDGKYIENGGHPAWKAIHEFWKSLDPECTEGSGWNDSNHLSFGEKKHI